MTKPPGKVTAVISRPRRPVTNYCCGSIRTRECRFRRTPWNRMKRPRS